MRCTDFKITNLKNESNQIIIKKKQFYAFPKNITAYSRPIQTVFWVLTNYSIPNNMVSLLPAFAQWLPLSISPSSVATLHFASSHLFPLSTPLIFLPKQLEAGVCMTLPPNVKERFLLSIEMRYWFCSFQLILFICAIVWFFDNLLNLCWRRIYNTDLMVIALYYVSWFNLSNRKRKSQK